MNQVIERQPVFFKIIDNAFKNNKLSHAYLLSGDDSNECIKFLCMKILCQFNEPCFKCDACHKVDINQHIDLIKLNGELDSIKKKDIENIISKFTKSSLESKYKVYIIENIENSSLAAMNSLLKFLEEPEGDTIAIFSTKNKSMILPTIISRCQTIDLAPLNQKACSDKYTSLGYELAQANLLSVVYGYRADISIEDIETLEYLYLQAINTMEDIYKRRGNLIINTHLNIMKNKKEKKDLKNFFKILIVLMKDLINFNFDRDVVFSDKTVFYGSLNFDCVSILNAIEKISKTQFMLEGNADVQLLMDNLMSSL